MKSFRLRLSIVPFFASLLVIGCTSRVIPTVALVDDFSNYTDSYYSGTARIWKNELAKSRISGKPRAIILDHGENALALRINLIRSAQKSIRIQTFAWAFDEVGKLLLWELVRANEERGVKIEILIDHMFSDHDPRIIGFLSTLGSGFQIKYFNPSVNRLSPSLLEKIADATIDFHGHNSRLHNKLFVADDLLAITGGRNVSNRYFDQSIGMNYKDRDVLVILPEEGALRSLLDQYWEDVHSVPSSEMLEVSEFLARPPSSVELGRRDFCPYPIFDEMGARANDEKWIVETFLNRSCEVDSVTWVYDLPEKVTQAPVESSPVSLALTKAITSARSEVIIQSPYFVLSEDAQELFEITKSKSPEVRVVVSTNSLAATDNWPTYAAHYRDKRIYLEDLGLVMWELKPIPEDISVMMSYEKLLYRLPFPSETIKYGKSKFKIDKTLPPLGEVAREMDVRSKPKDERLNRHLKIPPYLSLHAKSMVVDANVSYVGSYNLDPRSDSYNTEAGIMISDEVFAKTLRESIIADASPENSYLIGSRKKKPILSAINKLLNLISEKLPFWDPWPIRAHTSYRLRPGKEPVPEGHPAFFRNWEDVGNFPGLSLWAKKQISTRVFKATGMILKPLL
jgi:phosphatidylserine/phosphatidylglycerophosphate/cardiolipin synthase-like enzyme